MNHLVTDLARQCGLKKHPSEDREYIGNFDWRMFAELIVRECVEQCNINFVGTVGSHPNAHNRGVKKCIDNIKEHFGVLE